MIYGQIDNFAGSQTHGERVHQAFAFLQGNRSSLLQEGRHEIAGDAVFAMVSCTETRPQTSMRLENHHRYADLHFLLSGEEHTWVDFCAGATPAEVYNPDADIEFYLPSATARPLLLSGDRFLLVWPGEAHAPCVALDTPQPVRRLVIKILVDDLR